MFFAGIDSGSVNCKAVIINNDEEIIGTGIVPIQADPRNAAQIALYKALSVANIKKQKQISKIAAVGRNQKKIKFKNKQMSTVSSIARSVFKFNEDVRTIVDLGGFTNIAMKMNDKGKVMDYVVNDKCAAGSGFFLGQVSEALELDLGDLGRTALQSTNPIPITSQCSIFAESEVIYLVNEGKSDVDIAGGVCKSIERRIFSLLKRIKVEKEVVLTGGVANNEAIRHNIGESIGYPTIALDAIDPIYCAAHGGALLAKEQFS